MPDAVTPGTDTVIPNAAAVPRHTDAVIFDMDGVLVDSGPPHEGSWRLLAQRHGATLDAGFFGRTFGQRSCDIVRGIWGAQLSDVDVQRLDDEKEATYRELIAANVPLMPGCRAALARLTAAGYRLAVATSGPRENLELVLRAGELAPLFAATVHGADVQHGKPAPDCFLLAAERIGVPPSRCVVVEDAPVGLIAAIAAGMCPLALVGTHPATRLLDAGARRTITSFDELTPGLVGSLLNGRA
jgi:beta-phosphoglucomutase